MSRHRRRQKNRPVDDTSGFASAPLPPPTPTPAEAIVLSASAQPMPILKPVTDSEFIGSVLRRIRESRDENLMSIAEYLCIRPDFLAFIENGQYENLPADAYAIGFLRTYANYLGFDGREAIDRYRREMAGRRRRPELYMPQPITESRAPTAIVLVGAAIAALFVYLLWYALSDSGSKAPPPNLPQTGASPLYPITPAS